MHEKKAVSGYICHNIEHLIACKRGNIPLSPELIRFIEDLDSSIRDKLEEWEIITPLQGNRLTLSVLIEQYKEMLSGKQITPARVKDAASIASRFIKWCHYIYPNDIMSDGVRAYIKYLKDSGLSARTHNKHLQGIKQFVEWLSIRQMCFADLRGINSVNEKIDPRLIRRALTEEEKERLLESLEGYHHGLSAQERKIVYLLALEVGLRWNEIRTLSVGDIDLNDNSVNIQAHNEKSRKGANLPLSESLIEELSAYLSGVIRLPNCQLFEGIWKDKGGQMLKVDLKAANIEFKNEKNEQVDFHSLRHTYGTMLALSGISTEMHAELMRHSTIDLTRKYYIHFKLNNLKEGIKVFNKRPKIDSETQSETS